MYGKINSLTKWHSKEFTNLTNAAYNSSVTTLLMINCSRPHLCFLHPVAAWTVILTHGPDGNLWYSVRTHCVPTLACQHKCCKGTSSCRRGWDKHRRCLKWCKCPGGPQNQNWVSGGRRLSVQLVLTKGQGFLYLIVSPYYIWNVLSKNY